MGAARSSGIRLCGRCGWPPSLGPSNRTRSTGGITVRICKDTFRPRPHGRGSSPASAAAMDLAHHAQFAAQLFGQVRHDAGLPQFATKFVRRDRTHFDEDVSQ